jgi:Fe-S cluster biogenesis protein NfuA
LKFLPGRDVMGTGTADYPNPSTADNSPLATRLFAVPGVASVFLGADFVTVGKADSVDWTMLKPQVLSAIQDHFASNDPVVTGGGAPSAALYEDDDQQDSEVVIKIRELIETRVRPAVAQDGGDIIFRRYENGIVYLRMQGSCSGCPSSSATLKNGIENMLRYYLPEILGVQQVE